VYGAAQHSAVLTSAGDLYETGTCGPLDEKKRGSLTKAAFKDKVRLVALSDMTVHVVLEDNSVWYRGFSLENHLPKNEDKDAFTELKIWKDQTEAEKITQLTSGAGYTLAVTEAGNLWAWGEIFLGAIDFRS
jgi:alpha-tubulin suppressor-like RCC1 family protein